MPMTFDNLKRTRKPGAYFEVNANDPHRALPMAEDRILFLTSDAAPTTPIRIHSQLEADTLIGANSSAGRMIAAAVMTNPFMTVEALALGN